MKYIHISSHNAYSQSNMRRDATMTTTSTLLFCVCESRVWKHHVPGAHFTSLARHRHSPCIPYHIWYMCFFLSVYLFMPCVPQ